jgi:3-oxoacyl-[acyl-carrier protein] reductase
MDKVALVFGGSRGIGAAIVRELAADGASVALTYANSPEKAAEIVRVAETDSRPVIAIKADSTDPQAVRTRLRRQSRVSAVSTFWSSMPAF